MSDYTLAVIGCGTMGVAILSGVFDSRQAVAARGDLSSSVSSLADADDAAELTRLPSRFLACVARPESGRRLRKTFADAEGVEVFVSDNLRAARAADVVLLACKPHMVADVLAEQGLREALAGKLVCSICAGLRIEQMQAWLDPSTKVVRAMPNTPSKVSARELLGGRGRRRQMSSAPGMQLGEAERKQ
jgi:pyrroline-5-carboxylate reductase